MPTYDYVCNACGHRFEEFQSISADPLKKCPQCNKRQLERLIGTGAGVIFSVTVWPNAARDCAIIAELLSTVSPLMSSSPVSSNAMS